MGSRESRNRGEHAPAGLKETCKVVAFDVVWGEGEERKLPVSTESSAELNLLFRMAIASMTVWKELPSLLSFPRGRGS